MLYVEVKSLKVDLWSFVFTNTKSFDFFDGNCLRTFLVVISVHNIKKNEILSTLPKVIPSLHIRTYILCTTQYYIYNAATFRWHVTGPFHFFPHWFSVNKIDFAFFKYVLSSQNIVVLSNFRLK